MLIRSLLLTLAFLTCGCVERNAHLESISDEGVNKVVDSLMEVYLHGSAPVSRSAMLRITAIADTSDGELSEYLGYQLVDNVFDTKHQCRFATEHSDTNSSTRRLAALIAGELFIRNETSADSLFYVMTGRSADDSACTTGKPFLWQVQLELIRMSELNR